MSANNGDVLRDLAIAGLGMANLPTFLHYEAINKGLCNLITWVSLDRVRYICGLPKNHGCPETYSKIH